MPNLNRRLLTILLAAACVAPAAQAQTYPDKTIRLIVPWPAGGGADAVGRAVAQALTTELGKTVYVENVAGAGGNIGTQQFIRSAPDGYTLLLATSSTNVANPYLYKKTGFDPIKDFTPVASVALIPSVLVVPSASPFKTPQDIIAAAKAKPGKLSYGSGGMGASAHLAGELFKSIAKIDVTHVPYKGSGPALTDVMGGQLDFMFDTGAFSHIKGGKIRALAVAADKRQPLDSRRADLRGTRHQGNDHERLVRRGRAGRNTRSHRRQDQPGRQPVAEVGRVGQAPRRHRRRSAQRHAGGLLEVLAQRAGALRRPGQAYRRDAGLTQPG